MSFRNRESLELSLEDQETHQLLLKEPWRVLVVGHGARDMENGDFFHYLPKSLVASQDDLSNIQSSDTRTPDPTVTFKSGETEFLSVLFLADELAVELNELLETSVVNT